MVNMSQFYDYCIKIDQLAANKEKFCKMFEL